MTGDKDQTGSTTARRAILGGVLGGLGIAAATTASPAAPAHAASPDDIMEALTRSALRDDPRSNPPPAVYLTDPGLEGMFTATDGSTATDDGATVLVTAAGVRYLRRRSDGFVDVTWFGAKGDGTNDDTAAIDAASKFAALKNRTVLFPTGTYLVKQLAFATSWESHEGAIVKSGFNASISDYWLRLYNTNGKTIRGLTFDGHTSADPAVWTAANFSTFTGARGLDLGHCTDVSVENCTFRNCYEGGLFVNESHHITISACTANRIRGIFGDGYRVVGSSHVSFSDCLAEDYTRIGFVGDTNGVTGCYGLTFARCVARNGHHASINYAGVESNVGVWAENCTGISISDCWCDTNREGGFKIFGGSQVPLKTAGTTQAMISRATGTIRTSTCVGGRVGFEIGNIGGLLPSEMTCSGCTHYGDNPTLNPASQGSIGFHTRSDSTNPSFVDRYHILNCHSRIMGNPQYDIGIGYYATGAGRSATTIDGATIEWVGQNDSKIRDLAKPNYADIVVSGSPKLSLSKITTIGSAATTIRTTNSGALELSVDRSSVTLREVDGFARIHMESATLSDYDHLVGKAGTVGEIDLATVQIKGAIQMNTSGRVTVSDTTLNLTANAAVHLVRQSTTKEVAVRFDNCRVIKPLTSSSAIKIDDTGTAKAGVAWANCSFYNPGAATTSLAFIARSDLGTGVFFSGCIQDQNVNNLYTTGTTGGNPAELWESRKIVMH